MLRGPLVYFYAVIHTLITFEPPRMRVVHDGGTFEGKVMFAVVEQPSPLRRRHAHRPRRADRRRPARPRDRARRSPSRTLLSVFPKVYNGKHVGPPGGADGRTRRAEITIDRAMTMYGGGEPLRPMAAGEPVAVEVVPGGLPA